MTDTKSPLAFRVNISNRHVMVHPTEYTGGTGLTNVRAMAEVWEPQWQADSVFLGAVYEFEDGSYTTQCPGDRGLVRASSLRQALMILLGIDNVDELMPLLGELQLKHAELYPADVPSFIPSRFPFTYAADCLRQFPLLVPEDVAWGYEEFPPQSRSGAAGLQQVWAARYHLNRSVLAVALATVLLRSQGVSGSAFRQRYAEVMNRITDGWADADL